MLTKLYYVALTVYISVYGIKERYGLIRPSIVFRGLYSYVPWNYAGCRRHSSICAGISDYRRHSSQETQFLTVLRVTVGITTDNELTPIQNNRLVTPIALMNLTGICKCDFWHTSLTQSRRLRVELRGPGNHHRFQVQ